MNDPTPPDIRVALNVMGEVDYVWGRLKYSERELWRASVKESREDKEDANRKLTMDKRKLTNKLQRKDRPKRKSKLPKAKMLKESAEKGLADTSETDEEDEWQSLLNFDENIFYESKELSLASSFREWAILSQSLKEEKNKGRSKLRYLEKGVLSFRRTHISELNSDIIMKIFTNLDFPTYTRLYRTCKNWYQLVQNQRLKNYFFLTVQKQVAIEQKITNSIWDTLGYPDSTTIEKYLANRTPTSPRTTQEESMKSEEGKKEVTSSPPLDIQYHTDNEDNYPNSSNFASVLSESTISLFSQNETIPAISPPRSRTETPTSLPPSHPPPPIPTSNPSSATESSQTSTEAPQPNTTGTTPPSATTTNPPSSTPAPSPAPTPAPTPASSTPAPTPASSTPAPTLAPTPAPNPASSTPAPALAPTPTPNPATPTTTISATTSPSASVIPSLSIPSTGTIPQIPEELLLTLNEIIGNLTDPYKRNEDEFEKSFILMSPALATLEILSLKLIQRYYVPKELLKPAEQAVLHEILVVPIRLRVCILLKNIINAYWHLMSPSARRLLRAFVMVHEEAKQKNFLASQILKAMNKVIPVLPPRPVQPVVSTFKNMDFLSEFSPLDIAKTMTLIDWEVFKMIKPEEFLKQTWTKRPEKAPNLRAMIDRFNKITEWIVSHVVSGEKIKIRVKRYCKFVAIAEELKNFGSFHSFMAVLAALTQNPLTRLKFTLSEIPPRVKEQQKALEEIMSVENSYKNYRETLSSFLNNSKYPTIPYLGVFFRDIIYMDDGLKNDAGKYNTKYILSIYGIISQIQISQDHPGYPFEINEKLDKYLREMPNIFPTKILNDMVRQKEPKTATRADIE